MNRFEFKLPDIGEGVTEGEIVAWLIKPGDVVVEDQPMVEVMTDKATVTITAPKAGKVLEMRAPVGGVVPVHAVLVVFDLAPSAAPEAPSAPAAAPSAPVDQSTGVAANVLAVKPVGAAATAVGDIKEDLPGMNLMPVAKTAAKANGNGQAAPGYFNAKPLATPATRKLARDLDVDLRRVPPTGPKGRVTKDDVRIVTQVAQVPAPLALSPSHAPAHAPAPVQTPAPSSQVQIAPSAVASQPADERIPLRGMRKRIFEGMARSKHTAAHFTFVEECDATALKALRARLKPAAEQEGVKLTFLPFFVKACVAALKKHPSLNAAFDESTQEIVLRKSYHLGIASATPQGLIVPVVHDADRKSILDIARDIARLGDDARAGKSRKEDLTGSTFTITSLGQQGGLFATPILNFPEVAILGIHQMKQKPVVRDGEIVIGDVMLLSLSFDHRLIDGHVGAAFAYELIGFLENPDRLFLEMA
jgi:pyruvate dehydrogenase E2 component (dihydrolipoamide acetyltransferase)